MLAIDHAFRFCTESKTSKWLKYTSLYWNLRSCFSGDLETRLFLRSTRADLDRDSERRMERKIASSESNMAEDQSFEVRKQHLLTSYFGLSSTEELKNNFVIYHTCTSLTIDCAAIVNCRFRFVAVYGLTPPLLNVDSIFPF